MKLVMTLMVRDEADIIAANVEHHLAQGVDLIIATDNGSVDGTREILQRYADLGVVELHDDPRHQKQQSPVVSQMARRAKREHDATWVINADADEFFVPVDRSRTLAEVFADIPVEVGTFDAPVVNLTGTPGRHGSGLRRLVWRDERDGATLMESAGLFAQPSADAIHVGHPWVWVAQGNHKISLRGAPHTGDLPAGLEIEVLHLPWRSLRQHAAKVEAMGQAYDGNPELQPSANHHGMRDYRRGEAGYTETFYLYRHPIDPAGDPEFTRDDTVLDSITALAASGARIPELLTPLLDDAGDEPYSPESIAATADLVRVLLPLERAHLEGLALLREAWKVRGEELAEVRADTATELEEAKQQIAELSEENRKLKRTVNRIAKNPVVRAGLSARQRARQGARRLRG